MIRELNTLVYEGDALHFRFSIARQKFLYRPIIQQQMVKLDCACTFSYCCILPDMSILTCM